MSLGVVNFAEKFGKMLNSIKRMYVYYVSGNKGVLLLAGGSSKRVTRTPKLQDEEKCKEKFARERISTSRSQ